MELIHANAVELDGRAVVLIGAPGSGKSSLSLGLMERGGKLIADDYIHLDTAADGTLWASAPEQTAGKIEVRGYGILPTPHTQRGQVHLIVRLMDKGDVPRMPESHTEPLLGVDVPRIYLDPHAPQAIERLVVVLRTLSNPGGAVACQS